MSTRSASTRDLSAVIADPPRLPEFALELALDPDAATRVRRLALVTRRRMAPTQSARIGLTWFDTPEATLGDRGLSLCERRQGPETVWLLQRTRSTADHPWAPGAPPPLVGKAEQLAAFGADLPAPLLPVAAFAGRCNLLSLVVNGEPVALAVLHGTLRAVAGERRVCRLLLAGDPVALAVLVEELAAAVPLRPPLVSFAAEAHAVAGRTLPLLPEAPRISADLSISMAFACIAGHLVCALFHAAPVAAIGATPEPVHQMRVALRRLRSAVLLFSNMVAGPAVNDARGSLRSLSRMLGPARDLDVFLDGTGTSIRDGFPGDRSVARLLMAAERRRQTAYSDLRAYLNSPSYRQLALQLACLVSLRPWERVFLIPDIGNAVVVPTDTENASLIEFARRALSRRWNRVRRLGDDFSSLSTEALHALRIQCKRLRYAAEFFAPLFPRRETRQFIRRVGALQERLGRLNDGAVAESLMATLGGGGTDRAMAIGIVRGYVAAGMRGYRDKSERSWRRLRRLDPFWV